MLYISHGGNKKKPASQRIFDAHCDTVQHFTGENGDYHFRRANDWAHVDLPRLQSAGVKAQIFALFIEPRFRTGSALKRCLHLLEAYYRVAKECPDGLTTVYNWAEFLGVIVSEKIAALLLVEGGEALEGELAVLHKLFLMGIRGLGLTWNAENELAGAAMEGPGGRGLTRFGRKVVKEMNKLGMIIDLSHISRRGFYDVLERSGAPVIVSHANVAALCNHPRNLTDEQMKALKDNNGVLGMSFYPPFIDQQKSDLDRLLDHFAYAAEIMGVDNIGIGSDFDGIDIVLEELRDVSFLPHLVAGLHRRGFAEEEVDKILFKNFMRVVKEIMKGGDNEVC